MTASDANSGSAPEERSEEQSAQSQSHVFRDKRRIDPTTGEVRDHPDQPAETDPAAQAPSAGQADPAGQAPPAGGQAEPADAVGTPQGADTDVPDDLSSLNDTPPAPEAAPDLAAGAADPAALLAAERLEDLQRLQAEYTNYRKRVARDRDVARDAGVISVLESLMPVLDEVELARQHGDLNGPFETHSEKLVAALTKFGFSQFGEPGEEFDPQVHEALMQQPSADVDVITVTQVLQPGYKLGDRVLRAARVAVAQPE
ncbi:nucleotide exchange factor GrpE [Saxibacter everestensis]|uniref:Protein GrpE n=1 Tax=Saxibacter everestensis TaxID=2909229 RepID=A0ABY8QVB5_9MICO|nr:nucleotide exchange factor GrpE [Brevibacteriaceae bacterium ZFBP1038]